MDNITSQTIQFKANDPEHCFELTSKNVVVYGSTGKHDHGSSKVKLKNIVNYKWEQKDYPGRLIAVHLDGIHMAYSIKVNTQGMIRVVNLKNNERSLIKGMSNEILDLQFAHIESDIILCCIEETTLYVYKIKSGDVISWNVLLQIVDPIVGHISKFDRINWCPYVPEIKNEIDELASQLLVWVRGKQFQYYSVNTVVASYGVGIHNATDIKEGCMKYKSAHSITSATFSPDGTTLAISSDDGIVRFYQVYLHADETNPRCLHEWNPHDSKPISGLCFLDNLTQYNNDNSLWKHAITGAMDNTELKLWSCETWECTQTISLMSPPGGQPISFKMELDRTSSYLILNDIHNRGLYVLQLQKDFVIGDLQTSAGGGSKMSLSTTLNSSDASAKVTSDEPSTISSSNGSGNNTFVLIKSIAEFPLSLPILGFDIVNAAVRRYKCGISDDYLIDELDDYDDENQSLYCVVVKMYTVQPSSLQECYVLYQPTVSMSVDLKSTISCNSRNTSEVSLISIEKTITDESSADILKVAAVSVSNQQTPKPQNSPQVSLMTPDSFNSLGKKSPETVSSDVMYTLFMLANATTSPDLKKKSLEGINLKNMMNNKVIEEQEKEKIRKSVEMQSLTHVSASAALGISQESLTPSRALNNSATNSTVSQQPPDLGSTKPGEAMASGGSSPSREVQEILSLKENDCMNEYFDDSDNPAILDDNDEIDEEEDLLTFQKTTTTVENNLSDGVKLTNSDWPQIPEVPIVTASSGGSGVNVIGPPNISAGGGENVSSVQMEQILNKMDQLTSIIVKQSSQINELRGQLYDMQKSQTEERYLINSVTNKQEAHLSKLIEEYLVRYERQHAVKLENMLAMNEKQNREMRDAILHSISNLLYNQITEKMSAIFVTELQRHTLPLVAAKMDTINKQIQMDISHKLTASDQLIRENIVQVCSSKAMLETFGNSILVGVQKGLQTTYVETLVPSYEKCTSQLFSQMRKTFLEGINDFLKQFSNYVAQYETSNMKSDEILNLLQGLPQEIKLHNDKIMNQFTQKMTQEANAMKETEARMFKTIKENIKKEIENGFANQTASLEDSVLSVVRSQAQTPAPSTYDVQEQIRTLLAQNQINKAFHQALLANDLNLVEYTIERADFKVVFNPCPLEQTVLLSLIQQITADMNHHNELKQKYLSEAILNLNFLDTITKDHGPKIMRDIYQKCQDFLVKHPTSSLCSGVKMLIMAVQGMGFKSF